MPLFFCPVCQSSAKFYAQDKMRSYGNCENCRLIFVPRESLIAPEAEAERYKLHENSDEDPGYHQYLEEIALAIMKKLKHHKSGLDFGCGKSQILESIFTKQRYEMDSFDVYFLNRREIWNKKYDFIILSEVIEHLREPLFIMNSIRSLLNPDGLIFIKTKYHPNDPAAFLKWFYRRDITHVQFFDAVSMEKLARLLNLRGPFETDLRDLIYIMD